MKEQNTYKRRQGMSIVFSVVLHLVLLVLVIAASAMPVKEKPKVLKVQLASLKKPEPPPVQEVKTPEPPKPEPPKPEPPKPEPPKPEPPKPEPPKPEPPKQVAKPAPPKPPEPKPVQKPEVKPLPDPKPVVKNPPKPPETKPVVKNPPPKQEAPKPKSLAERLAEGRKQTQPVQQQPRKTGDDIAKRLRDSLNQPQPTTAPSNSVSAEMAAIEVETRSYAEEVVRPYIQRNWREPSKGELDVRNPSSVEVSFTVYASGNVANARIAKMSNSRVLNSSVQEFLRNMTRLSPLSVIGSKSSSLTIIVTMSITN